MHFSQLGLSQPILRALEQEGYSTPTPIQAQTIPHTMQGRDILGSAQTGTGKTAAFALPILHRLAAAQPDKSRRGPVRPRALILSPTRELASQIGDSFAAYGRHTGLAHTVIFGGVSQMRQEQALARGVDIIVATPGRLIDLLQQRIADLSGIEVFVLDEADRMLDMGFIDPIRRIAAMTPAAKRQTLLFSATMPRAIVQLAHTLLRDPVKIAVNPVSSTAPAIEQAIYHVDRNSKQPLLEHLLADTAIARALVFTRTKHGADRVGRKLAQAGISADTIHGNKSQPQRRRALDRFTTGRARVLVATDVAARGLDVDGITHVINFDLPDEPEAYVHRIGRTGRAGATGIALSFCDHEERSTLREIERLTGKKIDVRPAPAIAPRATEFGPANSVPPGAGHDRRHVGGGHGGSHAGHSGHAQAQAHPKNNHSHGPSRGPRNAPRKNNRAWNKPTRRRSPQR